MDKLREKIFLSSQMDKLREKERPFCPTLVGPCHVQTATDRFGNEAKRAILYLERVRDCAMAGDRIAPT
ncbi:hypothetical protein E4U59_003813 [Claviceps monticola]|nr:hypothetical protein E4U59_003813 [Claviceps monticola]